MRKLILLVLPLFLLTASCSLWFGPPPPRPEGWTPPPSPSAFRLKADYDTVWWAAVDTLDYLGYVIVQMRKYDGYLATDRLERYGERSRVRVLLTELGDSVLVEIDVSSEFLSDPDESGVTEWLPGGAWAKDSEVMEGIERRTGATALPPHEPEPDSDPDTGPDPAARAAQ